jgi:hypothetical protein
VLRTALTVRDRAEDVGRSLLQLLFGTWMVLDARRTRPAATYFARHDTEGRPLDGSHASPGQAAATCPYTGRTA